MHALVKRIFHREHRAQLVEGTHQKSVLDLQATIYEQVRFLAAVLPEGHALEVTMCIKEERPRPIRSELRKGVIS